MKQKPQGRYEGSWLGWMLQSRPGVILSNWVFQGMRYMNAYEVLLKFGLDFIIAVLLYWLFGFPSGISSLLLIIIVAHTINWVINGHLFVLMRYVYPVPKTPQDFEDYVTDFGKRAESAKYIDGVAIYGSFCRKQLHEFSDLDVRVIVKRGLLPGVGGALFCFKERFMAFLKVFPLDVYCCVETNGLERLRDDEIPVILLDRSHTLENRYAVKGV